MRTRRILVLTALSLVAAGLPLIVGAQQQQAQPRQPAAAAQPAQRNARAPASIAGCIPADSGRGLEQCGGIKMGKGFTTGRQPRSQLRTSKRRAEAKKQQPRGPSIEIDAATMRNRARVQARARSLLDREVRVLNRLVRNTDRQNPRRPDILLRLAETYFEMQQDANARVRGADEPIHQACNRQKNAARCNQLRATQRRNEAELNRIREQSIRTYAILVQDHPNFRRMDEVLFSLGFALEEMRQFDRARQVYHRLIKGFPQSRFIPNAYLSFAEYYFNQSDMRAALQFYQKVAEFPAERNPVYGFAVYKQAWVYYNMEDFRGSLQKFVETIEFATQHPEARDAANLARQSRRELVLPYAQVGNPSRALEFFSRYATNRAQALEMFEALGELYYDTGQWPNTIAVYHKLMSESPQSDKVCYWQGRVTNAIISSRPKPEQVRETQRMLDVYDAFRTQRHSNESQAQCKQTGASILVELATAWHREAIGTEQQPGTNDRNTMRLAAELYQLVTTKFPDMERMEFPEIDRRDWPTNYKVSYYFAELLWKMEDWERCGPAFDRVVQLNPQGEFTSDAAYAAVLCYNNLYQQQFQADDRQTRGGGALAGREGAQAGRAARTGRAGRRGRGQAEAAPADRSSEFTPREFNPLERGMLAAFQRYICVVPDSEDLPTIKYRRARIYYEANHYEEAALLFKEIAFNHAQTDLGEYAANLYLDSLNILGTHRRPARAACYDEIGNAIDPLHQTYCATEEAKSSHEELCNVLGQLKCDILRKKGEALQGSQQFRDAARTYVEIFRRYPECGRLDEVLWNAAINYEAARLVGRAIRVRTVLIERYPESEFSKRGLFLLGANYHALAIYGKAADYYEEFARKFPGELGTNCSAQDRRAGTCTNAAEALQNAVFFRLGLGESEKAIDDARMFERNYKSGRNARPREVAQVIYSLGSIYERQAAADADNPRLWSKVRDHYTSFLRQYGRTGLPQHVIRANVQIGLAYLKVNDRRRAEAPFRAALAAWEHGTTDRINSLPDTEQDQKALYLLEAKTAASEALFHLAEYKFADFRAIEFPEYRGGRQAAEVTRWAQGSFKQWLERKTAALRTAEEAYNRVAALEVPQWQIAAANRVGNMYTSFVEAFDNAPVPTEIENDPELYDIYVGELNRQRQIFFDQAIPKFEFCLITATRVRWFNEFSRECEVQLNRLNPAQYPLAMELRGQPGYIYSERARPGAVDLGATVEEDAEGSAIPQ